MGKYVLRMNLVEVNVVFGMQKGRFIKGLKASERAISLWCNPKHVVFLLIFSIVFQFILNLTILKDS